MRDLRHAFRALRKNPGFTCAAVITLALGIGANTAIFSAVYGVLVRPLPVQDLHRIVVLHSDAPGLNLRRFPLNPASAHELNARRDLFEAVGGYRRLNVTFTEYGEPQVMQAVETAGDFFRVIRASPQAGRLYGSEASQPGEHRIAVVSYGFWERVGGRDPSFIGRKIQLNEQPFQIIGVLPQDLGFPRSVEIWMPMPSNDPEWRPASVLTTIARLRFGITMPEAQSALQNYAQTWGTPKSWDMTIVTQPFLEYLGGRLRPVLLMLMGAAAFVLLIVCANVAGLQLVRATGRAREMAVRTAIGASRGALMRQSLVESLLLALIGGTLGLALGSSLLDGLAAWHPASLPELANVQLNRAVMAFSICASLFTGIVFGLVPALRSGRADVNLALRTASRTATNDCRPHRLLSSFAAAQVSLAFLLLTGAFLLIRSFGELVKADPGFRTDQLVAMTLNLPAGRYAQPASLTSFYHELQNRLSGIPAVETSALTTNLPLSEAIGSSPLQILGRPGNPAEPQPHAERLNVSSEYFGALGIALLRGRLFEPSDASPSQPVVLIDAQLARDYFSGQDPIGKQIQHSGPVATIIGVVGSTSQKEVGGPPKPTVYYFIEQHPRNPVLLVLRTSSDAGSISALVRNVISQIDATVPIANVRTVKQQVNDSLGARQFGVCIVSGFAALALILSIVGIYGVLSYVSRERTQEFGIRLAMGAQVRDIVTFVLWRGARLIAAGLLIGLAASLALARVLSNQLYNITPHDPVTLIAVTGILGAVALLACSLPAWRAGRVDPAIALRDE